jgi:2-amino-4-hydroxy-6-hydroxymethyldihydropteridine diphosphokinase
VIAAVAYIGLGSNLGDRRRNLERALEQLERVPGVEVLAVSRFIETEPVGPAGQGRYLNAAAALRTALPPGALLEAMQAIESAGGRDRAAEQRHGPRTIDLDLLLYGQEIIDGPPVTVPHPRMHERPFVLEPLAEIAANALHPAMGVTIESLRDLGRTGPP